MSTVTFEAFREAEHFLLRNARLIDRHRYAFAFQSGSTAPILSVLDAYRNLDGGYGNALHPDLRGHGSQPLTTAAALHHLGEIGALTRDRTTGACRYLTSVTDDDGGVPCVLPTVRHTEAAPWWRETRDFSGALDPTATIAGLLHAHHSSDPWRDRATAFCWTRLSTLNWTTPGEAAAICTFLQHVTDRPRARAEFDRIAPMIRVVIDLDPAGHGHRPLDFATRPDHIARRLFTDAEIEEHLDALREEQQNDGGWNLGREPWTDSTRCEWRAIITLRRLLTLHAYGRIEHVPALHRTT